MKIHTSFLAPILALFSFLPAGQSQSLRFSGSDYIVLGNDPSLKLTSFTLEAWIIIEGTGTPTSTGTGGIGDIVPIISKGRAEQEDPVKDVNYFLGYQLSTNKLVADFEDNAGSVNHPVFSNSVLDNCWTHVAATYNAATGTWKLYINGDLDQTAVLSSAFVPQSLSNVSACIGASFNSSATAAGFFNGRIDEVRIWNVVRTDAEMTAGFSAELTGGIGLAGRWGFNEGAGNTAGNSVAGGPAGSVTGTPLWKNGFDQPASALDFNGSSDYVTFGAAPGLNTVAFTLEAWIMIEGAGATASSGTGGITGVPVITKGLGQAESPANLNMNYFFGITAGNILVADFEESSGPNHPVTGATALTLNNWTHIAATYAPTSAVWNLYINGTLDKTLDLGANISPVSASIQHSGIGTAMTSTGSRTGFFNGKIDEVRIWNRALSQSEIQTNLNEEITSGTGLIGRWGLNEGCGLTTANSVPGGVNGMLGSSAGPVWTDASFTGSPVNLPPDLPDTPSPADAVTALSVDPDLCAMVDDPGGDNLQVRFFGRPVAAPGSIFTIVWLPDTQYYVEEPATHGGTPAMFNTQTAWIVANEAGKNIVYVGQLGDCVEHGDAQAIEWTRATTAMYALEPPGIPYGICVGNHDQSPIGDPTGSTTRYNNAFGVAHFSPMGYYGGHSGSNNDNHYEVFTASGINFMIISLEYDQTANFTAPGGALDWAEDLVEANPSSKVMVMSHWVLSDNGNFSTQGSAIYNRLKAYPNFILMVGGHDPGGDGEARRTDVFQGHTVHTVLSDYQGRTNGGNGLLRTFEFDPEFNDVAVQTYSPVTGSFESDASSEFTLPVNLTNFSLIGQLSSVPAGTSPCMAWTGLSGNTGYEWYVEVFDGVNTTIGPVWSFTTPNVPLPVSLIDFKAVAAGNVVELIWQTAAETNNSGFEVQRSDDARNWQTLGWVKGAGTTNEPRDYGFTDAGPLPDINYYRLNQIDWDNNSKYSRIVSVFFETKQAELNVFPNPARGKFNISAKGSAEILKVTLYDSAGRQVMQSTPVNGALDVSALPGGAYFLDAEVEGKTMRIKVVIE